MTSSRLWTIGLLALPVFFLANDAARAASAPPQEARPQVRIPRLEQPPRLEDFLSMRPESPAARRMARVEGFIQRNPSDGSPAVHQTEAFIGYDDRNLYVVFVAYDPQRGKIRARLSRRENTSGDDFVEVTLDTFHDQRRGFLFRVNPLGIQSDALWTEGGQPDFSFDTLWHSRGRLTTEGYVVLMAIPFKSLRFTSDDVQSWGIVLQRNVPRASEVSFWPRVSSRIEGRLNQAGTLTGLENISPGRNIQLIPYSGVRSFRALNTLDPNMPFFRERAAAADAGLDAKVVLADSFVLDITVNPDFSQVESDSPQTTANQRFEVFFPEKRPFFLENANFFETPVNLLFTRRIADPSLGVRLSGKAGPYALGALLIDDQAPGKVILPGDTGFGKSATFAVGRVSRDILDQSNVGFIFTNREFAGSYNRVFGVDSRLKFGENYTGVFQAVRSKTRDLDGIVSSGPAYRARFTRDGRQFFFNANYFDFGDGFNTEPGFVERTGIREYWHFTRYRFRPEGKFLIAWGPNLWQQRVWDRSGTRLDWNNFPSVTFEFVGDTFVQAIHGTSRERIRPADFDTLTQNVDFKETQRGIFFQSSYFETVTFGGNFRSGDGVNFVPPDGEAPSLADFDRGLLNLTLRPVTPLHIENSYILSRLRDKGTGASILNNHIFRSNWNWQFNRELSLRFIAQYDSLLTNPEFTGLETRKSINADFLITYLINPGTALFIGYNSNAQNLDRNLALVPGPNPGDDPTILRTRRTFINDSRQFFVKFSYLVRF